ncbi:DUF2695 domain-containing protein [Dactylosporangium sp. CS-033363]|uniref:DUF2695 domain-containing protein n=1 Tax=Dactylosporangium sp. CS-033363 TaxID=3239935 RepID=UPI003D8FAD15
MGNSPEKARRRQLRDAYKNADRAAGAALMPLDAAQLQSLVEFVDGRLAAEGCDHSTRHAERWARDHGVEWDALRGGLAEFGGYCDCEVVLNCGPEEVFG